MYYVKFISNEIKYITRAQKLQEEKLTKYMKASMLQKMHKCMSIEYKIKNV